MRIMKSHNIRVTYLTQVPGPYREKMHERLSGFDSVDYTVVYCAKLEPNRSWNLTFGKYTMHFLKEKARTFKHNDIKVWKLLNSINPDVLIITAFKPTMLFGVLWCWIRRRKLVVYNDGTIESERDYSKVQKLIRRLVFKRTHAFVAPGMGTMELYRHYSIAPEKMFKSCLCIDNAQFSSLRFSCRPYHIMFSGQIIERKMPIFFVEVARRLKAFIPDLKVLVVGDGDMRHQMSNEFRVHDIDADFVGFLEQRELPEYYSSAKIFLFPTLNDPWGIVANEACASGTPVITCPVAGVANDLIVNNINGYVHSPNAEIWADRALSLLLDEKKWYSFSVNAIERVKLFNHDQSANGILESVKYALHTV